MHRHWSSGRQYSSALRSALPAEKRLQFDTAAGPLKGGDKGPVIVPGKPQQSKLLQVLAPSAKTHMPPKTQLEEADIAKLRAWVTALGRPAAASGDSKSARRAERAEVPQEPTAAIDYFLAARWHELGLTATPVCDDRTFVRRVMLDLVSAFRPRQRQRHFYTMLRPPSTLGWSTSAERRRSRPPFPRDLGRLAHGPRCWAREDRRRDSGWSSSRGAFKRNRPWDDVVRAIITARPEQAEDRAVGSCTNGASTSRWPKRSHRSSTRLYHDCAQVPRPSAGPGDQTSSLLGPRRRFQSQPDRRESGPAVVQESAVGGNINFTNLKRNRSPLCSPC